MTERDKAGQRALPYLRRKTVMRRTRVSIAILITAMMITLAAPMAAYAGEHGGVAPPLVAIPTASIVLVNRGNKSLDDTNPFSTILNPDYRFRKD